MRPSPRLWALAAFVAALTIPGAAAQPAAAAPQVPVEDVVVVDPNPPVSGSGFVVRLELVGIRAALVDVPEPVVSGSARYLGADVRPDPITGGARVELRFLALEPGGAVIPLLVMAGGVMRDLGPVEIRVAERPGEGSSKARPGSWDAPASAWRYHPFVAKVLGPSGGPAFPVGLSIPGAVAVPLEAGTGEYLVSASRAGALALPALDAADEYGPLSLAARLVSVRALPVDVEATRAIGSWSVELRAPADGDRAVAGDLVAFELAAVGTGSAGHAEPPTVRITGPDGRQLEPVDAPARFGQSVVEGSTLAGVTGLRGAFRVERPGTYAVAVEPYAWLDPADGTTRLAKAPAAHVIVVPALLPAWEPSDDVLELASALVRGMAASTGATEAWRTAAAAAGSGDWAGALAALVQSAQAGSLPPRFERPRERVALAAVSLAAGDRVAALSLASKAERAWFPPPQARLLADRASESLGTPPRPRDILPGPGWCMVTALAAGLAAAGLVMRRRAGKKPRIRIPLAVAAAALALMAASLVERSERRVVCDGGPVMVVPDPGSTTSFMAEPGLVGGVDDAVGDWLFVHFPDGRSGWMTLADVYLY